MAFSKYAKAAVISPVITHQGWSEIRHAAVSPAPTFEMRKATQVVLGEYDPSQWLLSHCTIVASVDTESPVGLPLGKHLYDGVQVERKYPDFYISLGSTKYVNNNHDAFERKLLMGSFRTFVGGQNYVEHVQIPEMSKGRIIDAAARDIGDAIYIDILVATERKHRALISAITTGQLGTLSMGCQVSFTICTKCGNVAEDETQLCKHIKYEKGNFFIDTAGQRRKVAELCGHMLAEPGSVKFIEASWVANPAFKGAVLRNILDPKAAEMADAHYKMQAAFQMPVEVADASLIQKAARRQPQKAIPSDSLSYLYEGPSLAYLKVPPVNASASQAKSTLVERLTQISTTAASQAERLRAKPGLISSDGTWANVVSFDDGMDSPSQEQEPKGEGDPLKKHVDDLYNTLVDRVTQKVRDDLSKSEADKTRSVLDENKSNESLIKSALQSAEWRERAQLVVTNIPNVGKARNVLAAMILFSQGSWDLVRKANRFSGSEILVVDRLMGRIQKRASMAGEARVYRTVIAVGGTAPYPDVNGYLTACSKVMGRVPTESERALLVAKGKLFSMGL